MSKVDGLLIGLLLLGEPGNPFLDFLDPPGHLNAAFRRAGLKRDGLPFMTPVSAWQFQWTLLCGCEAGCLPYSCSTPCFPKRLLAMDPQTRRRATLRRGIYKRSKIHPRRISPLRAVCWMRND